jgi:flavin reductase (DIM6/NTAB) family NADH-FMN oxidoreductase RutF
MPTQRARVEIDPAAIGPGIYPLLNSVVVPRPIAWVVSRSAAGVDNLAPHSFFTVSSVLPPVVQFTSVGLKDSLRNIRETGEFVVCTVTRDLAELCNLTSTPFGPATSEIDATGLSRESSQVLAVPRVAQSPVALECRAVGEHAFGDSTVVFGEVVHVAIDPAVLTGGGWDPGSGSAPLVDLRALRPVSRLGSDDWAEVGDVFALRRLPLPEWEALAAAGEDPVLAARRPRQRG